MTNGAIDTKAFGPKQQRVFQIASGKATGSSPEQITEAQEMFKGFSAGKQQMIQTASGSAGQKFFEGIKGMESTQKPEGITQQAGQASIDQIQSGASAVAGGWWRRYILRYRWSIR